MDIYYIYTSKEIRFGILTDEEKKASKLMISASIKSQSFYGNKVLFGNK